VRPLISILISLFGFVQNAALPRVPGPLPTQAALPSSARDPEALAAVQSAISTMGGAAVIGAIQSAAQLGARDIVHVTQLRGDGAVIPGLYAPGN
jgi:hypothetical protein